MYVGDIHDGSGLHHMLWEVLSNALDLHAAGLCTRIDIELLEDGGARVQDDGPGFLDLEVDGRLFLERALTELHFGPSLDGHVPHDHAGLFGVGLVAVNALSAGIRVRSNDGRSEVRLEGFRGEIQRGVDRRDVAAGSARGAEVVWWPDPDVFDLRADWDGGLILHRLREFSALNPALQLTFADRRQHRLHTPCGLAGLLHVPPEFSADACVKDVNVQVAAGWSRARATSHIRSLANLLPTSAEGVHVQGAMQGMVEAAAAFLGPSKPGTAIVRELITKRLHMVLCVRLADPAFAGPTREVLRTPEAGDACRIIVGEAMANWLRAQPQLLADWRQYCLDLHTDHP